MKKLFGRKEAASLLGVSVDVLDAARKSGLISYVQYVENGSIYFTEVALEEFLARSTYRAKPIHQNTTFGRKRKYAGL